MEQTELEKCRNDMVYFAEKYLGAELKPWQKTYLKILQQNKHIIFYGVRDGKNMISEICRKHDELLTK